MSLSPLTRDSFYRSWNILGGISIIFTVLGISTRDFIPRSVSQVCLGLFALTVIFCAVFVIVRWRLSRLKELTLTINGSKVNIYFGDIFKAEGCKVIGCDTKFSTDVDDIVISRNSLHGRLLLGHADINEVINLVVKETGSQPGTHDNHTGKVIRYSSGRDGQTYLMLAMTKLNDKHEAHTTMPEFMQTLVQMWKEINSVYNGKDIVLPLLGTGITRFDDGPVNKLELMGCMLYALKMSRVQFHSVVKICLWDDGPDPQLYEYKYLFGGL